MKTTIFFDLGNVLIFFDHKKMCQQAAALSELPDDVVFSLMKQYGDLYERGLISSEQLHQEISKQAKQDVDFTSLMTALSDIFQPNPPVIELALRLKQRGHRLFLLSNTCESHFAFARKQFDFLDAFDGFVLSYEVQARKPEPTIFHKALEIANCAPQDSFYTDDILDYVVSARSLQIDSEQYTDPESLKNHLSLRGLI